MFSMTHLFSRQRRYNHFGTIANFLPEHNQVPRLLYNGVKKCHSPANRNPWNRTIYTLDISQLLYQWATFRKWYWKQTPELPICGIEPPAQAIRTGTPHVFNTVCDLKTTRTYLLISTDHYTSITQCHFLWTIAIITTFSYLKWHKFFNASQLRYASTLCG